MQAQLMQVKAQLSQNLIESRNQESQWPSCNINGGMASSFPTFQTNYMSPSSISPQSSLDSIDCHHRNIGTQDFESSRDEVSFQPYFSKKRHSQSDLSELQHWLSEWWNTDNFLFYFGIKLFKSFPQWLYICRLWQGCYSITHYEAKNRYSLS